MKNVAVIGASPKEERYSYKAIKFLVEKGYNPIPVAPAHTEIQGKKVYEKLTDIDFAIDTVSLYIGPARQTNLIEQILTTKPARVIFNPGTENPDIYGKITESGIEVLEACTLILLKTNQF